MRIKEKIRNKGFWISLVSAAVMILQAFGLKIDAPVVNEILTGVLGILVILGIVSDPSSGGGYLDETDSAPEGQYADGADTDVSSDELENDGKSEDGD